jgi:predicted alpha/beta-fold hydrolase
MTPHVERQRVALREPFGPEPCGGRDALPQGAAPHGVAPRASSRFPCAPRLEAPAFVPARGLRSGHAQTVFSSFAPRPGLAGVLRERVELPDGDFVDILRWPAPAHARHVLVLHGLESSPDAGYVRSVGATLAARGSGVVALGFRTCSGVPNRLPRTYHAGDTADARYVLARLRRRVHGPIDAVGFSLGGSVLLNLLAEEGEATVVRRAAVVSAPLDLEACVTAIDAGTGMLALYRERFLLRLRRKARDKAARFPGLFDLDRALRARTLRAFDTAVTAPLHGFASAEDYYARASAAQRLHLVARPTLFLHAADDPLVPEDTLAAALRAASGPGPQGGAGALEVHLTEHGGHVGFIAGSVAAPRYWSDEVVARWLSPDDGPGAR